MQVCHAVDPVHEGSENASVLYIAACPTTANNKTYVKKQLSETLAENRRQTNKKEMTWTKQHLRDTRD